MTRTRQFMLTAMLVVLVATASVSAQSSGLTVTTTDAAPGETTTVTVEFTNDGDDPMAAVVSVTTLPDSWSVQSHADDGGTWRDDRSWLFQSVPAGGSVAPSITVAVPEDASGSYTVVANATASEETVTRQTTVSVAETGATATDTETSGGSGPGFGAGITIVAILALALGIGRSR